MKRRCIPTEWPSSSVKYVSARKISRPPRAEGEWREHEGRREHGEIPRRLRRRENDAAAAGVRAGAVDTKYFRPHGG